MILSPVVVTKNIEKVPEPWTLQLFGPCLLLQLLACFRMENCNVQAQCLIFVSSLQEKKLPAGRERLFKKQLKPWS